MTSVKSNYQARSSKEGKNFEDRVYCKLLQMGYQPFKPSSKLVEGPTPDFFYFDENGVEVYVECKGGQKEDTAGARRGDNVLKAVAEGLNTKLQYPNCKFHLWFSAAPNPGQDTINDLLRITKGHAYDEVFYLPYKNTS